jgi:S-adenosylmethionine hydrolase
MRRLHRPPPPAIALLSDFGTGDTFVGQMHAAVLALCPDARLIDLTHAIGPQDVRMGAWRLREALAVLPDSTVCLAVVDPGVGTERAGIGVSAGGLRFVGPDNGLLWPAVEVAAARGHRTDSSQLELAGLYVDAVSILPERVFLHTGRALSRTFHGRDLFAPAAALLAAGSELHELGPPHSPQRFVLPGTILDPRPPPRLVGEVLWPDRFGNVLTSLDPARAPRGREPYRAILTPRDGAPRDLPWVHTYDEAQQVAPGTLATLVASGGCLELVVAGGSAWALLPEPAWRGAKVELLLRKG